MPSGHTTCIYYQQNRNLQHSAASAALLLLPSRSNPSYNPLLPSIRPISADRMDNREFTLDLLLRHGIKIEISAGASTGRAQPDWIDIVRTFLVGLND